MKLSIVLLLASAIGTFAAPIQLHARDNYPMDQAASDVIDQHLAKMKDPDAETAIHTHMALTHLLSDMPQTDKRYQHDPQAEAQVVSAMTHLITRQDDNDRLTRLRLCFMFPQASFCQLNKRTASPDALRSFCANQPNAAICKPRQSSVVPPKPAVG
jgi:hypothetical protein